MPIPWSVLGDWFFVGAATPRFDAHHAASPALPQSRPIRRNFAIRAGADAPECRKIAKNRRNFAGLRQRPGEKDRLHRNYRDFRRV
jgi:hypothetical protein